MAVSASAVLFALVGTSLAGAETASSSATTQVISIELLKGKLKFVGPSTVAQGDQLEIVNDTNPKQVGPHTFSLVTKGSLPKTGPQRQKCFSPKHICLSIAEWHGFNPKTEKITKNPAKAGPAGWSTMGSISKKGDSWFTETKGETIVQEVTAEPSTLYYICAVHPWMQGQVTVTPPPAAPLPG
ncbi:MAG TPA: hypothetical protein VFX45_01805 [Solirubrobacterales bacterium]|nr:hypothetical protein [Solirubrobacterales bacterium]